MKRTIEQAIGAVPEWPTTDEGRAELGLRYRPIAVDGARYLAMPTVSTGFQVYRSILDGTPHVVWRFDWLHAGGDEVAALRAALTKDAGSRALDWERLRVIYASWEAEDREHGESASARDRVTDR